MRALLPGLLNVAVVLFAVTSMLSVGLANSVRQILGPLRDLTAILRALLANFVLVPLLALAVLRLLPLERPLRIGLILVAFSAGAPFVIKLLEAAGGRVSLSATLLVLLLPVTVVYTPIVVPLVVPDAEVAAGAIAVPLFLSMLLPLFVGMLVRARWLGPAQRLQPLMRKASTVALVLVVAATVLADFSAVLGLFTQGAFIPALLVVAGAFVIGYVVGGPDRDAREVLGFGTSQRNIAAATVIASQSFADPRAVLMVVVTSLAGFAVLFPVAWALRKRRKGGLAKTWGGEPVTSSR